MEASPPGVFSDPPVHFHFIESPRLKITEIERISQVLTNNGAVPGSSTVSRKDDKFSLEGITHVITSTVDFPDYDAATELARDIKVVKPDWVNASLLKKKQAHARQYSPDPRMYFSGLIVSCADLPDGDRVAIEGYVLAVGGLYSGAITKQVTHIVALDIENEKCQAAIARRLQCKIVLPHWIDDCLKLGRRIDESPYCLPDPEILAKGPDERIFETNRLNLVGASSASPSKYPTQIGGPTGRDRATIFMNKKVMLSTDLHITSRLRGIVEDIITGGNGSVTGSVHKADYFICQYRESPEFRIASRAGKTVGNLAWLYYLITHNTWTSPMRQLLHYPVSKDGLPGFKDFRISISNYNGEARIYLENLARAAGAEFTKTMKDTNTHLITAHSHSEKCAAAREWNIHLVNHLWLEESYAKWQVQTLSNPRYTHLPSRTNLGEVVGQTNVDKDAVEKIFFPPGSDMEPAEAGGAAIYTSPSTHWGPAQSAPRASPDDNDEASLRPLRVNGSVPASARANQQRSESNPLQTPAPSRLSLEGKENQTPSTGSRSAKQKATVKIHGLAPDIALFEKESKRVGGVIHGGKRNREELVENWPRKRSRSVEEDSEESPEEVKEPKKRTSSGLPPIEMRILVTGYKRWLNSPKLESAELKQLRELGILIIQDATTCTHVASPRIVRTQKFICAVARAPAIINTSYLDDCLQKDELLDPKQYPLNDAEYEKHYGFKLTESLRRATKNQGSLLRGHVIFCTDGVPGGFNTFKTITQINGGDCLNFKGRGGWGFNSRKSPGEEERRSKEVFLVSGTSPEDARLWPKFRQMVEERSLQPRIVRTDWLLNVALSQQMKTKNACDLTEEDIIENAE